MSDVYHVADSDHEYLGGQGRRSDRKSQKRQKTGAGESETTTTTDTEVSDMASEDDKDGTSPPMRKAKASSSEHCPK